MARQHVYTVKSKSKEPNSWVVYKLEKDFEPAGQYSVSRTIIQGTDKVWFNCDCYAGNKPTCRHRAMVELFLERGLIDSGAIYQFDKQQFIDVPEQQL
jgi:hypothetical protein